MEQLFLVASCFIVHFLFSYGIYLVLFRVLNSSYSNNGTDARFGEKMFDIKIFLGIGI
jgi:hypothetical protein